MTATFEVKLFQKLMAIRKGGPLRYLPGPAQGVGRLGCVQMTGYPGGICRGTQDPTLPLQVLREAPYGGKVGGVIQRTNLRVERHDSGGPAVSLYLQCGGVRSGPPMGIPHGGRG